MENFFYFCHFLDVQLQKDSEWVFHSFTLCIDTVSGLKDYFQFLSLCAVRESTSSLVSVQSFHLMIKETENTGQCVHHILAEDSGPVKGFGTIWLSFLLLPFLANCNLNLLNFTVKFCISHINRCVGTENGQNILRPSTVFMPEEMCKMFISRFQTYMHWCSFY